MSVGEDRWAKLRLAKMYPERYRVLREEEKSKLFIPKAWVDRVVYNRRMSVVQTKAYIRLAEEYPESFKALKNEYRRLRKEQRATLFAQKTADK